MIHTIEVWKSECQIHTVVVFFIVDQKKWYWFIKDMKSTNVVLRQKTKQRETTKSWNKNLDMWNHLFKLKEIKKKSDFRKNFFIKNRHLNKENESEKLITNNTVTHNNKILLNQIWNITSKLIVLFLLLLKTDCSCYTYKAKRSNSTLTKIHGRFHRPATSGTHPSFGLNFL